MQHGQAVMQTANPEKTGCKFSMLEKEVKRGILNVFSAYSFLKKRINKKPGSKRKKG